MTELATIQPPPEIDVAQLLQQIVKSGVTADAASAVKELVLLKEHQEDRWAKRQFFAAMSAVRSETKTIQADKGIPDKLGNVKWYYTPLEELQDAIEPIVQRHSMQFRFTSRREGNICTGVCHVWHDDGHEVTSECAINVASAEGGDLGAIKKAKRGALTAMFALKTSHMKDDDPRILGDFITPDEAEELEARIDALAVPTYKPRFLKWMKADSFDKIYNGRLADARRGLAQAEAKKAATGGATAPPVAAPNKGESMPATTGASDIVRSEASPANSPTASSASPSPAGAGSLEDQAHAWATETEISDILKVLTAAKVSTTYSGMIECAMERAKYIHFLPEATREELRRIGYEYKLLLLRGKNVQ